MLVLLKCFDLAGLSLCLQRQNMQLGLMPVALKLPGALFAQ